MAKSMRKTKVPNEGPGHLESLVRRLWSVKGIYIYGHYLKESIWKKSRRRGDATVA